MIKLLALDLDGTTLMSDHVTISPANQNAIQRALDNGIHVVIATGRMLLRLPASLNALKGLSYFVNSNGAMVYHHTGEGDVLLYSDAIPLPTVFETLDILEEMDIYTEVYCNGACYTERENHILCEVGEVSQARRQMLYQGRNVVPNLREFLKEKNWPSEKINLPYVPADLRGTLIERLVRFGKLCVTSSLSENLELNSKTANKGAGLQQVCKRLAIEPEQVMVIGDSNNDLDMFRFAGLAVAMENAEESVKKIAHFITATNDEDGVALAIEKYLL